jgi:hypothetical protein
MKKIYFLALGMIVFLGCASFKCATYYPEGKYASTNPSCVQIYHGNPPRPFEVIGEAYLSSGYVWKSEEENLKKQIAEMGGDAAICHVEKKCGDAFLEPAKTNIEVAYPKDKASPRGEKKVSTIESSPAQVKTNCVEFTECQIIKLK